MKFGLESGLVTLDSYKARALPRKVQTRRPELEASFSPLETDYVGTAYDIEIGILRAIQQKACPMSRAWRVPLGFLDLWTAQCWSQE